MRFVDPKAAAVAFMHLRILSSRERNKTADVVKWHADTMTVIMSHLCHQMASLLCNYHCGHNESSHVIKWRHHAMLSLTISFIRKGLFLYLVSEIVVAPAVELVALVVVLVVVQLLHASKVT